MRLRIKRYQKKSGVVTKAVVFCLDVRVDLTEEEKFAVQEYNLGSEVIYNSERSRKHLEKGADTTNPVKALARLAMAKMSLNVSINSLTKKGHTIECKSLDEVLAAEEAVNEACKALKQYIKVASRFKGEEVALDF